IAGEQPDAVLDELHRLIEGQFRLGGRLLEHSTVFRCGTQQLCMCRGGLNPQEDQQGTQQCRCHAAQCDSVRAPLSGDQSVHAFFRPLSRAITATIRPMLPIPRERPTRGEVSAAVEESAWSLLPSAETSTAPPSSGASASSAATTSTLGAGDSRSWASWPS